LNYGIKEISFNHGNICGDRRHQKPDGHILAQKNQTGISHAMERSQLWSNFEFNFSEKTSAMTVATLSSLMPVVKPNRTL
jgi:hypothetical protein